MVRWSGRLLLAISIMGSGFMLAGVPLQLSAAELPMHKKQKADQNDDSLVDIPDIADIAVEQPPKQYPKQLPQLPFDKKGSIPIGISIQQQARHNESLFLQQQRDYLRDDQTRLFQPGKGWSPLLPPAPTDGNNPDDNSDPTMLQFQYRIPFH